MPEGNFVSEKRIALRVVLRAFVEVIDRGIRIFALLLGKFEQLHLSCCRFRFAFPFKLLFESRPYLNWIVVDCADSMNFLIAD